jgi:TIGR03009 family protein
MRLGIGYLGLLVAAAMAGSVLAQNYPPRDAGPDQPVQPQTPVLIQRAPQQPGQQSEQQQPPAAPFTLTPQEESQVDRVLGLWEQRNKGIKTFDSTFTRWVYDVVALGPNVPKSIDFGTIRYAAPDRGSYSVDATEKNGQKAPVEGGQAEKWICDGKSVFFFDATKKQLVEHKLPPALQGKAIADSPLPFLFGAQAQKLKQRYWIKINPLPPGVQDQIELEAWPRYQQDKANFDHANFIITASKMEPYALKIVDTNKQDYRVYRFDDIVINNPLRLFSSDPFRAVTPFGWQKIIEEAPTAQARTPTTVNDRK